MYLQLSPVYHGNHWRRKDLSIANDKKVIELKLWGDLADTEVNIGDFVECMNLNTHLFHGIMSLSITDETEIEANQVATNIRSCGNSEASVVIPAGVPVNVYMKTYIDDTFINEILAKLLSGDVGKPCT